MNSKIKSYLAATFQSILLGLGMYFLGRVIRNNWYFELIAPLEAGHPELYEGMHYLGHLIFIALLVIYLLLVKEETHYLQEAKFSRKKKDLLWMIFGFLIGFIMNAIAVGGAILHGDIDMVSRAFDPGWLLFLFVCIFIQSSAEELQDRMWTHNRIQERANMAYAVIGTSLTFSLTHMLNAGISLTGLTNIFLIGCFWSIVYKTTGSLWCVCSMHCAWNFSQNCIFGLPNSGIPAVITVMEPTFTNKSFFYDPDFGVEGSGFTMLINMVAVAVALLFYFRKQKKAEYERA